ncbi:unnamed protein product [Calicophoron daubneyi]|uniref:Uncharacterized protein n=1 Tax=Calicophoron daubneyi TaxID=300641 RepID=A0AAV2TYT1_CALDB
MVIFVHHIQPHLCYLSPTTRLLSILPHLSQIIQVSSSGLYFLRKFFLARISFSIPMYKANDIYELACSPCFKLFKSNSMHLSYRRPLKDIRFFGFLCSFLLGVGPP